MELKLANISQLGGNFLYFDAIQPLVTRGVGFRPPPKLILSAALTVTM